MRIRSLGYDPEADELDLLVDVNAPVPAEAIPIGEGIYIRRDRSSGHVVGALIRGYSQFLRKVQENQPIKSEGAAAAGFSEELAAIIAWQEEVCALSQSLARQLGDLAQQREFVETVLSAYAAWR